MGRSSGLGNVIDSVVGSGTIRGTARGTGFPTPFMPTENIGIMTGAIRKKGEGRRDERGSRRDVRSLGLTQVTMKDPKTGKMYGGLVKDGVPKFKAPDGSTPPGFPAVSARPAPSADGKGFRQPPPGYKYDEIDRLVPIDTPPIGTPKPKFDPSKPSAVMETERVNVQDPTLGGPPEREVPLPKEKDMTPRGPAPFAPNEGDVAKRRFFETMFERAANQKERRAIDKAEMIDRQEARRDEAMMRDSEMGGRRRGRRDFTRRRPERRRSKEERAAFRDRYVSTLGNNFFS